MTDKTKCGRLGTNQNREETMWTITAYVIGWMIGYYVAVTHGEKAGLEWALWTIGPVYLALLIIASFWKGGMG